MPSLRPGLDRLLAQIGDFEGEIRIVHAGSLHRLLVRAGTVVAARVAGHYDPLLGRLRGSGNLSEAGYRAALESMATSERRAGELARKHGVRAEALERALQAQLLDALDALRRRVDGTSAEAVLVSRRIEPREIVAFARLSSSGASQKPAKRAPARTRGLPRHRALARIARELHPDRLMHLPEAERRRRERRLAHLSARLQGL